jgi:hypothetical protein
MRKIANNIASREKRQFIRHKLLKIVIITSTPGFLKIAGLDPHFFFLK